MAKKRFSAELIVTLLRQIAVSIICPRGLPSCRNTATQLHDELLNGEVLYSLKEAHIVIEQWRKHCNMIALSAQLSATGAANTRVLASPSR